MLCEGKSWGWGCVVEGKEATIFLEKTFWNTGFIYILKKLYINQKCFRMWDFILKFVSIFLIFIAMLSLARVEEEDMNEIDNQNALTLSSAK